MTLLPAVAPDHETNTEEKHHNRDHRPNHVFRRRHIFYQRFMRPVVRVGGIRIWAVRRRSPSRPKEESGHVLTIRFTSQGIGLHGEVFTRRCKGRIVTIERYVVFRRFFDGFSARVRDRYAIVGIGLTAFIIFRLQSSTKRSLIFDREFVVSRPKAFLSSQIEPSA